MGSPVICLKHGKVFYVATSPILARAIADGCDLSSECCVVTLEVVSQEEHGKTEEYLVDLEFLAQFSLLPIDGLLTLKDRSKKEKLMNDRLVLNRVFSETVMVCPYCLNELVSSWHRDRKSVVKGGGDN